MRELALKFHELFAGLDRAHGKYVLTGKTDDHGKAEGRASTERTPPTVELWEKHLAGDYGLGVIPIRDDATCRWGGVDIDHYPLDHQKLCADVRGLKLPLLVGRTKSGGAHLWLFTSEDVPAELIRNCLMEWAAALGYAGVEVFPKQTRLASQNDYGNWLNMPYFGGNKSLRYAFDIMGKRLSVEAFIELAYSCRVTERHLREFKLPEEATFGDLMEGAPPCLQSLCKTGFPAGSRNNGLFNIAVYLKKRYEDDWATHLDQFNQKFMNPPLGSADVQQIIKSVNKKTYQYKCKDHPIHAVCNKQICLTRRFGVGQGEEEPGVVFGEMLKLTTTPPAWIWDIDGARIELTTEDLMNQARFQKRCIEELTKWPNMLKPAKWQGIVREKLAKAEIIEVPVDATVDGQLMVYLQRFCLGQAQGRSKDELLMGKPFTDKDQGRTYFCSSDFLKYLEQQKVRGITEKKLYTWLRKNGVMHEKTNIKGRFLNHWSIPSFPEQTEAFDVPEPPKQVF